MHVIAADAPKITDWWSAIVATVSVFATVGVAWAVARFTNGYRMRIRAVRDSRGTV
jgi:hypothetical protein